MTYNDVQLDVIDNRVRAAVGRTRATGTMVSRDPNSNNGTALFDGSSVAVPVKVLPHTWARADDRVVLDRYGSDWVVTGSFGTGMHNQDVAEFAWSDTTTSATNVVIAGTSGFSFTKERDTGLTVTVVELNGNLVTTVTNTVAVVGVRVNGVDYDVATCTMNTLAQTAAVGRKKITALDAGVWPVEFVWRRTTGTGSVTTGQTLQVHVREAPYPLG